MGIFRRQFHLLKDLVSYTGEISHFEFDANRVSLTGASDLKLFVGGVWVKQLWTFQVNKPIVLLKINEHKRV